MLRLHLASGGISTVSIPTNPTQSFVGIVSTGNLVQYSRNGETVISLARITGVVRTDFQIEAVATVAGVCNGALPTSNENVSDLQLVTSPLKRTNGGNPSGSNTLLHFLNLNVESVDLEDSDIIIRRQFDVQITNNSTNVINAGISQVFLPFDEERYNLVRSDGSTEVLTEDKFEFSGGSTNLQINNLGTDDPDAKLITTLRKSKVTSKTKLKIVSENIIVNRSSNVASGIGSTTLNDGLEIGNFPFGTRVQDSIICLNNPDVYILYGVFESS